ncbi:hypothetical protein ACIQF6_28835 [Kitasatospora sp. NPDC092948]|uniref:hypothetical protein n=1 Tax=Kitasatospora sp. NPDC092948 TaxID=3364088 RepID=UPI003809DE9E
MNPSQRDADRLWLALDLSQIPGRVVHTGTGVYSVEAPIELGGISMTLEMAADRHGLLWQFLNKGEPLFGATRSDLMPDEVPAWVLTMLSHLGGRLGEPYFKVGDRVLVGPPDSRHCMTVQQVVEIAGEHHLMGDTDARQWPASAAVHAVQLPGRRAAQQVG